MTGKRMSLEELSSALEKAGLGPAVSGTLASINSETRRELQNYHQDVQKAFEAGEKYLKEPLYNSSGSCPNCGSREYFDLFGGRCNKSCANCGTAYDCISLEDYLKHPQNPI